MEAGHAGDAAAARGGIGDADPAVRSAAVGALDRMGALTDVELGTALADGSPAVRRRALEVAARRSEASCGPGVLALVGDRDPEVVEVACWAAGERADLAGAAVDPLVEVAAGHPDPLCREAAVAALGSIGRVDGLPTILAALDDRPPVRRRAVLALAPFEGPEVEAALGRAREGRDRQVRQAAEDLLGERAG